VNYHQAFLRFFQISLPSYSCCFPCFASVSHQSIVCMCNV